MSKKKRKLTPKQAAWCEEYLIDLNATQAAIRAGYSEKTAKQMGGENLTKPDLMAIIAKGKRERSKRTNINADWVLSRLGDEAEADLADLYNDDGTIKPMRDWPMIWRQGLVAGIETAELADSGVVIQKVKVSDRIKRIELIGKHVDVSAFQENVNLGSSDLKGKSKQDVVAILAGLLKGE